MFQRESLSKRRVKAIFVFLEISYFLHISGYKLFIKKLLDQPTTFFDYHPIYTHSPALNDSLTSTLINQQQQQYPIDLNEFNEIVSTNVHHSLFDSSTSYGSSSTTGTSPKLNQGLVFNGFE